MNDVFHEQLVKKKPATKDMLAKAGIIAAAVFLLFAVSILFMPATIFLLAGEGFLIWFLFSFFDVEYEYSFTSGELDIDIVYARRRRKRLLSVDVRGVEGIRKLRENESPPKNEEMRDCTDGTGENVYVLTGAIKGKRTTLSFQPNDDMLKAMSPFAGRKLQR